MAFVAEHEVLVMEKEGGLQRVRLKEKTMVQIEGLPADVFTPPVIDLASHEPGIYPASLDGQLHWGNGGLFDIALHPDFQENSTIFLSYVSRQGEKFALKVISAVLRDDILESIQTILTPGPYVAGLWHFGGGLHIVGQRLYVTVGERLFYEGFKEGLPIAQDVRDARGAIYCLELDGSIPKDNPDFGDGAIPGLYAIGIRAAQALTHRHGTEDVWFSEHGTNQGDEINLLKKGANYGWPNITSGTWRTADYAPTALPDPVYEPPMHFWLHTVAPTGLTFYTGSEFPSWQGNLLVTGLSRGSFWRLTLEGNDVTSAEELFLNDRVRARKVVQSPGGLLYILTDEPDGKIIRIINEHSNNK